MGLSSVPQNSLYPQRDQPLLMPWACACGSPRTIWRSSCWPWICASPPPALGRHWADGHGRAAFDPKMMVVLLGTARASGPAWVIEKRCARDVGYRVITSELHPDHAAIARFGLGTKRRWTGCSARCAVARGCRRNGSARHAQPGWHQASRQSRARANRTLPPIETAIAEAAEKDAAGRRSARRQTRSR